MLRAAILSVLSIAICSANLPAEGPTHPVVIELFTAQACVACPPADLVMEKLAAQSDVVAITRAVTYFDRDGWRDSLALQRNGVLQRAYVQRKIPGAGLYTPQMVVQGRTGINGAREGRIRGEIVRQSRMPEPGLAITPGADGGRVVRLSGEGSGQLWVAAVRRTSTVRVGRGPNSGRMMTFANVVVSETRAGYWPGGDAAITIPAATVNVQGADRYVLLVRQGAAGPVLAARYL